jgi:putative peptide maturation system protein
MMSSHSTLLTDLMECLAGLARDEAAPEAATRVFEAVRARYPELRVDLVHESEGWGDARHYEAVVQLPDGDAMTLAYCSDLARPWILRAAQRWSEKDLLRVDGTVLGLEQALACIDFIWGEAPVLQRLVNACIVQDLQEQNQVTISEVELQVAMDAFRRAQRLYTVDETQRWLRERGLTHERLEEIVGDEATVAKQRRRIVGDRVAEHFATHAGAFDTATILECRFPDRESAKAAHDAVRDGAVDLAVLATERVALGGSTCPAAFRVLECGQEPSALAAAVFAASPGALLEPVAVGEEFVVARVLALQRARFDGVIAARIERALFDEWLAEKRQAADIEWFWGSAARTNGKV